MRAFFLCFRYYTLFLRWIMQKLSRRVLYVYIIYWWKRVSIREATTAEWGQIARAPTKRRSCAARGKTTAKQVTRSLVVYIYKRAKARRSFFFSRVRSPAAGGGALRQKRVWEMAPKHRPDADATRWLVSRSYKLMVLGGGSLYNTEHVRERESPVRSWVDFSYFSL